MKVLLPLFSLTLLAAPAAFAQSPAGGAGVPSGLVAGEAKYGAATVSIDLKAPTNLKGFLEATSQQMETAPSIAFKMGTDERVVPMMSMQKVRFGDLLQALEQLVDVKFTVINPNPKKGESSIITVDESRRNEVRGLLGGDGSWVAAKPKLRVGTFAGGGGQAHPSKVNSGGIFSDGGAENGPGAGASANDPLTVNSGAVRPAQNPYLNRSSDFGEVAWVARPSTPKSITSSYAIGSLVADKKSGHSAEHVIEAINLAWSTADETSALSKNSRIALHEPSNLLIIKAAPEMQNLAAEIIVNLRSAQDERQREATVSQAKYTEMLRERDHERALHRELLERLKVQHADEVDKMRKTVAELEAELRQQKAKN